MPPKRQSTRVTFAKTVKANSDPSVRKRKKKNSEEEKPEKRQRRNSPEDKITRLKKGKNPCPLQAEIIQHVDACINTAILSVLSGKKQTATEPLQVHLSRLRQRMLQLCKDMRVPATKLGKLKNLSKDVLEEERMMEEYKDIVESLNHEIEEAVETTEKIEESLVALEEKMEALKQQEPETSQSLNPTLSNKDPLQLPQSTFEAATMQDQVKNLDKPEVILEEVSRIRSRPVYKNMLQLLQTSYAEISTE